MEKARSLRAKQYEYFEAQEEDLEDLLELGYSFLSESKIYGVLTPAEGKFRRLLEYYASDPMSVAVVAREKDTGHLVGYFLGYTHADFSEESIGEAYQLYVLPEYRVTSVGHNLVLAASRVFFDRIGADIVIVELASGVKEYLRGHKSVLRWMSKIGFEPIGTTFMKRR